MFLLLLALSGMWDATINVNGNSIPFQLEISAKQASFFDGNARIASTSERTEGDKRIFTFARYATTLEVSFKDGQLVGTYGPYLKEMRPLVAVPHAAGAALTATHGSNSAAAASGAPDISGEWEIIVPDPTKSRGEHAWRLLVEQSAGKPVAATIQRVDGDTGWLTGAFRGGANGEGQFVLSHFSGARALLAVLKRQADGTLAVDLTNPKGTLSYVAARPATARAQGLQGPEDPMKHTGVLDARDPFRFSFPDLDGKLVANTDARFQGKVVILTIMGSWCPNCHDEAPVLEDLYRKYHNAGLEIVAVSFEDRDDSTNRQRLRFFAKTYHLDYPVLLGGATEGAFEKFPQASRFDSWPTTFFLGRDGRVRAVHVGFSGPATGALHTSALAEFREQVEHLLAEGGSTK